MIISGRGTPEFWQRYRALPVEVRALARKNYRLRAANALHPSLRFKSIGKTDWSVRVGAHYRAVGKVFRKCFSLGMDWFARSLQQAVLTRSNSG